MGFLGLNFGKTSGKSSSNSIIDKNENVFQQSSQNTSGTTASQSTGTQQSQSTGSNVSTQTGTSSTDVNKTSTGVGTTNLFGDQVLGGLQDSVLNLLHTTTSATPSDLLKLSAFNRDDYVNGTVAAAQAKQDQALDATRGQIGDMVGSKIENSSMASLLAARAAGDASANIAGIRSQAEATGAQIENERAQTTSAASGATDSFLVNLLAALKGGQQTTSQSGTEGTTGTSATSQSGTTNTTESSAMQQASSSLQTIQQLVEALLNGTTTSHATESTTGKTSGTTMGANLQLGKAG